MLGRQFILFVAVGSLAAGLNFFTRLALSAVVGFPLAVTLAFLVGLSAAFVLNRWLVFPHSHRPIPQQITGFLVTNLAFLPPVLLSAMLLSNWLTGLGLTRYAEEVAHLIAIALPTVFSYLIYKFRVFGEPGQ